MFKPAEVVERAVTTVNVALPFPVCQGAIRWDAFEMVGVFPGRKGCRLTQNTKIVLRVSLQNVEES